LELIQTKMKIKICGITRIEDAQLCVNLGADAIGFIFYPKSKRYILPEFAKEISTSLPIFVHKIGVFVNESLENILTIAYKYKLDGIQLHGTEMVEVCNELKKAGYIVIKAFPIAEAYNFKVTKAYEGACDYFLFDTKTDAYGGSGIKFDWTILSEYTGNTAFLLSGGIAPDDAEAILKIQHHLFAGIDLNSRFELKPGEKNVSLLREFMKNIR